MLQPCKRTAAARCVCMEDPTKWSSKMPQGHRTTSSRAPSAPPARARSSGVRKQHSISWDGGALRKAARAEHRRARARRFLQKAVSPSRTPSRNAGGRSRRARYKTGRARVCATYECASTYAARSCLMTLRVAEFNNRTMYRACAFVTAPLAIKPATARPNRRPCSAKS